MLILGISAYHGDSSAAILRDGKILAAAEEERFTRIKHWAGFPKQAIAFCLKEAKVQLEQVDYIAINRNPRAQMLRKAAFVIRNLPRFRFIADRIVNRKKLLAIHQTLEDEFGINAGSLRSKIRSVEHHLAHAAGSFFFSNFNYPFTIFT